MREISAFEATQMRSTQSSAMNDLCNVTTNVTAINDWGEPILTGTTISGIACGVTYVVAQENRGEEEGYTQVEYDAIIRLALTVALAIDSTITIVDKQDTAINKTYKLTGFPEIGPSAQNVFVEEITT